MSEMSELSDEWVVLDCDSHPLPVSWPTEGQAIDEGLCGRYLLRGHEVVRSQPGVSYQKERN